MRKVVGRIPLARDEARSLSRPPAYSTWTCVSRAGAARPLQETCAADVSGRCDLPSRLAAARDRVELLIAAQGAGPVARTRASVRWTRCAGTVEHAVKQVLARIPMTPPPPGASSPQSRANCSPGRLLTSRGSRTRDPQP